MKCDRPWVCGEGSTGLRLGYTLTEIIIVTMIVGLLSLLSLAVFSRQKQAALQSKCQNNLRQIYLAWENYSRDNDAKFPNLKGWDKALTPYTKGLSVFVCPCVAQEQREFGIAPTDYGLYAGRVANINVIRGKFRAHGASEALVLNTDRWILMSDAGGGSTDDTRELLYPRSCAQELWGRNILGRGFPVLHSGGGNYLFADGHVKWLTPQQGVETDCSAGPFLPRLSDLHQ